MRAPDLSLVDRHSARLWCDRASVLHVRKLCEIVRLFVPSDNLSPRHKWLEALVKVVHANTCVGDCQQNEYNSQDRKNGEGCAGWAVLGLTTRLIYAYQLEEEICECGEI